MNYTEKSLMEFTAAMSIKLDLNQMEKGDSWATCDISCLQSKLDERMEEYWSLERDMESAGALVDVANFCMMLYRRHVDSQVKAAAKTNRRDLRILLQNVKEEMESALAMLDKGGKQ